MAITFDTGSAGTDIGTSITVALTGATAGASVVVAAHVESADATSATYNGNAMTAAASRRLGTTGVAHFYAVGAVPDTGSHNVVANLSALANARLSIWTWLGVASVRVETWASVNGTTGNGTPAGPGTIVSPAGELYVVSLSVNSTTVTITTVSPGVQLSGTQTVGLIRTHSQRGDGAASVSPTWTINEAVDWATVALSLQPSAAAGQPAASRIQHDTPGLAIGSVRRMAGRLYEPSRPLISIPNPRETRQAIERELEVCHR
jgi:hypothetical protein